MSPLNEAIIKLLEPERPAQAIAYRMKIEQQEQRERDLISEVTIECVDAMADIASAMRYPRVGADDIEAAIIHLQDALKAARALEE